MIMKYNFLLAVSFCTLSLFFIQSTIGQSNVTITKFASGEKDELRKPKIQPNHLNLSNLLEISETNTNPPAPLEPKNFNDSTLGTIYFSNQPFPPGGSIEGAKTRFNSSEFVYGRLVLKGGTVRSVLKPLSLDKPYDDVLIIYFSPVHRSNSIVVDWAVIKPEDLDKTYWDFELLPNPENLTTILLDNKTNGLRASFCEFLYYYLANDVSNEGEQRLGVEIAPYTRDFRGEYINVDREKLIKGQFIYNFRASDYQFVKSNSQKVSAASRKIDGLLRKLPDQWSQKSSPLAFGVTESSLRSMFLRYAGSNTQILKFYAYPPRSSAKWVISTNVLGIPTVRYHNQMYMIFYKDAANGSCYSQDLRLFQRYAGGGKFSVTTLEPDNRTQITCSKLGVK